MLKQPEPLAHLENDTAVYHALAFNPQTYEYDIWVGTGTRTAITKHGFQPDLSELLYCPKEWLVDGWRDRPR
jgi:hypothetical protein